MARCCIRSEWSGDQQRWIKEYVLDGASDVAALPALSTQAGAGSTAHYGEDGELVVYELAPGGSWVQIV